MPTTTIAAFILRATVTASVPHRIIAREHAQGKPQPMMGTTGTWRISSIPAASWPWVYGRRLAANFSCVSSHDGKGHPEKVSVQLSGNSAGTRRVQA
ncbi:MAG: hypothetical protein ABIZ80_13370 [Bryobacteraceae bacterium]